jgi:acetyl-CoA decarbonylase/synthase complex subunit gamma
MKSLLIALNGIGLVAAGIAGQWFGHITFAPYAICLIVAGFVMLFFVLLRTTYYRSGTQWAETSNQPGPLHPTCVDYLKVAVCWFNAFKHTYAFEPGLYYTGKHYDREAPLLVTSNYFLTVFLIIRRIRRFNARLLVIDTDGINVWCAAGKGKFSNAEILRQLDRYDRNLLTSGQRLSMILPKLGLAGVNLRALRKAGIKPVIGPIYAKDLPAYLSQPPFKDRNEDRIKFGLQSRLFTWIPGLVQYLGYSFAAVIVLWGMEQIWGLSVPLGLMLLTALLATAYPILFPLIPGVRFAVKGLWLAAFTSTGLGVLAAVRVISLADLIMAVLFTFATAVFIGLSYTGNSAVSNYSRVRKETAHFLPLNVLLYLASFATFVITEVYR